MRAILLSVAVGVVWAVAVCAQPVRPDSARGHANLEGYWTNETVTTLERPLDLRNRFSLTPAEAREYERGVVERLVKSTPQEDLETSGDLYELYLDAATWKLVDGARTSLIVDPPDGRLPSSRPEAEQRIAMFPKHGYDDPETFDLAERCLVANVVGSSQLAAPMVPNPFGQNYYQIIQTPTYVLLHTELMHETRVIRMGGTHVAASVRTWLGDSVGHWEGDTLVVDTTNFNGKLHFRGSGEQLHVVERLTRVGPDTIRYRATVEDPDTWTAAWTIEYPFTRASQSISEYACHEGNYSLENSLRGHRAQEKGQR